MRDVPQVGIISALAYGKATFVAFTHRQNGTSTVLTSNDGISWSTAAVITTNRYVIHEMIFAEGLFVAAGTTGFTPAAAILTSSDGTNWTQQTVPPFWGYLTGLTYGKGRFVAVGRDIYTFGIAVSSEDGTNWMAQSFGGGHYLQDVAYGGGLFVAVGVGQSSGAAAKPSSGIYQYSRDGIRWFHGKVFSSVYSLENITYGRESFVAVAIVDGSPYTRKTVILRGTRPADPKPNRPKLKGWPFWLPP